MRRVLEAMLDDAPAPPDALESLTDEERAEIASLARTANLTALTLHQPDPDPDAAEKALERAEKALERRGPVPPITQTEPPQETRRNWLERLLKRGG
jgi:sugar/nucleoside kinase (ribokinase family)